MGDADITSTGDPEALWRCGEDTQPGVYTSSALAPDAAFWARLARRSAWAAVIPLLDAICGTDEPIDASET